MSSTKQIAMHRVRILFSLAKQNAQSEPELAQRYIRLARKVAMRARLRLPREYRFLVCRKCKSFILPGVNCRTRIQPRREPHMVITCLSCGKITRIPIKGRKNIVNPQNES